MVEAYRTGHLHVSGRPCSLVMQEELEYWGLPETLLQPCCNLQYFPNTVSAGQEKEEDRVEQGKQAARESEETFGGGVCGQVRLTRA